MSRNRDLGRRLLALEARQGSKIGDDCAHLSEAEMSELIDLWARRLDGEVLPEGEHGRFLSLDGKIVRSGKSPYSQVSDDELHAALIEDRGGRVRPTADPTGN